MFGGGVTSTMSSSGVAERNLNRITIVLGLIWVVVIIILGLFTRFGWA
jgi:preprotein translocase subunit SecG